MVPAFRPEPLSADNSSAAPARRPRIEAHGTVGRREHTDPAKLGNVKDTLTLGNLIDGKIVAPARGAYLDVFEPAAGSVFARWSF